MDGHVEVKKKKSAGIKMELCDQSPDNLMDCHFKSQWVSVLVSLSLSITLSRTQKQEYHINCHVVDLCDCKHLKGLSFKSV